MPPYAQPNKKYKLSPLEKISNFIFNYPTCQLRLERQNIILDSKKCLNDYPKIIDGDIIVRELPPVCQNRKPMTKKTPGQV